MKSNKTLMVIYNTPPLKSGAAMQALLLFNELKNNNDIEILSLDLEKVESSDYKRIYTGSNILSKTWSILYITFYISFSKYDTIHHISLSKYTYFSVLLSKLFAKKVIAKMTMFNIDDPSGIKNKSILKYIFSRLDFWIAIAPGMLDNKYENITFIPNAVTIPGITNDKPKEIIFLCSGVICQRKNQIRILEFWKSIQNNEIFINKNIKLVFIGSYQNDYVEYDKKYIDAFLNKASEFPNIEIIGHTDNVKQYLIQSTYYISFSTQEGLSNSLLESLSYMLYPIVFDESRDTLVKELYDYGYYFNDFNHIDIDFNDRLEKDMLCNCLIENYSMEKIQNKYLEIYEK
jgi:hypothetical protein